MTPVSAAAVFLDECIAPDRAELERSGVTVTIDAHADETGNVVASVTFRFPKALAEQMASDRV